MSTPIYQPFESFDFNYKKCFLSGESDASLVENINILPPWLLQISGLTGSEQIQLLDETVRSYNELKVPCSSYLLNNKLIPLEEKIATAFTAGYAGVKELTEMELFNWIGKFMYGFIYTEMNGAIRQNQLSADGINMGQGLMHKFGNLHTMLQNIYRDLVFEDFSPWSILIVPLADIDTPFSFRDEINTLTFSLKFKDFGIIACLQDNSVNKNFHSEILDAIEGKPLTAQQFEELCARFYYSSYLFNRLPEYNIMLVDDVIYIDAMPLRGTLNKPIFDVWQHKTYGQVLENFWKPWGHTLFEIIKDPTAPMSYFTTPALPVAG
jgi:hypothetical protein